jgi:hypothetical protein
MAALFVFGGIDQLLPDHWNNYSQFLVVDHSWRTIEVA